jgi:hypothetical protein
MSKESNRVLRNSRLTLHDNGKSDNRKIDTCVIQAGVIGQGLRTSCTGFVTSTRTSVDDTANGGEGWRVGECFAWPHEKLDYVYQLLDP